MREYKEGESMDLRKRVTINLLYKILLFPSVIYGAEQILPTQLQYSSWVPAAVLSTLFIFIGVVADETILPLFGNELATIQGSLFMTATTWMLPFIHPGNVITLPGAAAIGISLGIIEYAMHGWIVKQRRLHQTHS
ncbi:DUF2512 family protein [Ammoniphilus sp. CFH 90114]|uniref:DUF2512 family protein n=1 Tax=Ammoniphilus sp. CFH 90114 TaxID=2493665 RepID=UPI00100EB9AD|nr:DUF2512 family protein [Ammoniphilus sp. CFH 90114]RXT02874.1 DUF2512 family protein [Ammoniphilus sp. CFH 90114]